MIDSVGTSAATWRDPRVIRGMERQLEARRLRLEAGERPIGWKLGLGAPRAREAAALSGPVVGFLTDRVLLASGVEYGIAGHAGPSFEAEIGIHLGRPVPPAADRATAAAAIRGLGAAIELVDIDLPLGELETLLAGNVFNRSVILGPVDEARAGGDVAGLSVVVTRSGADDVVADDMTALVGGDPVDLVRYAASYLAAFGQALEAGDVVISGSIIPIIPLAAGDRIEYALGDIGSVGVTIAS